MPLRLIDHCEPLFQAVCRLNRMGRKGSSIDYSLARAEINDLFEKLAASARGDIALGEQYRKVELPLIFFVDSMIVESALPFAQKWDRDRLAKARKELAGDEKFFDLLEETLQDSSEGAAERLAVFYTCIGLGFTGWYAGQPEFLRKKMLELAPRVKLFVDSDETGLITPESYKYTNMSNLPMPMAASLVPLLIILLGSLAIVLVVNVFLFRSTSDELARAIDSIVAHDLSTPAAKP